MRALFQQPHLKTCTILVIDQEMLKPEASLSSHLLPGSILRAFEHRGTICLLYDEDAKEKGIDHFFILDLEKQKLVDAG